jgi:hypothetical protein
LRSPFFPCCDVLVLSADVFVVVEDGIGVVAYHDNAVVVVVDDGNFLSVLF